MRHCSLSALVEDVDQLITQLGPLPAVADLSAKEVLAAGKRDKKVVDGTLHFIAAADRVAAGAFDAETATFACVILSIKQTSS